MVHLSTIRNTSAERIGLSVIVSASRCEQAGIALAYVGLSGIATEVDAATGEVLVQLDPASHERFMGIEGKAFSKSFRDSGEMQWFCSGVLEVIQSNQERVEVCVNTKI